MAIKRFLETGKIVSTHGIRGDVRVQPWCDDSELLTELDVLYLDGEGKIPLTVERAFVQKNVVVLKFQGIETIEQAQKYRNRILYIDRRDLELPEGTYFIQDLIGCRVIDADDPSVVYGKLTQVSQPGANDVYHVVDENGKERLIPAIPDVVLSTDPEREEIQIRPLKGLFDHED